MVGTIKNDTKFLTEKYHRFRENARQTAFHLDEFSEAERIEFDLEDAGITGKDNNRNYTYDRPVDIFGSNGFDIRELRDR